MYLNSKRFLFSFSSDRFVNFCFDKVWLSNFLGFLLYKFLGKEKSCFGRRGSLNILFSIIMPQRRSGDNKVILDLRTY